MASYEELRPIAEKVAAELEGTSGFLHFVVEEHGHPGLDDDQTFCDILDSIVFCCTQCGTWHDVGNTGNDIDGEWCCNDCSPMD